MTTECHERIPRFIYIHIIYFLYNKKTESNQRNSISHFRLIKYLLKQRSASKVMYIFFQNLFATFLMIRGNWTLSAVLFCNFYNNAIFLLETNMLKWKRIKKGFFINSRQEKHSSLIFTSLQLACLKYSRLPITRTFKGNWK